MRHTAGGALALRPPPPAPLFFPGAAAMASLRRAAPAALGRLWALPFALRCHPSAAAAADVAGARAYAAAADGALGPTANSSNAAGDLRGTSGVGLGDGISAHTDKWMTVRALSLGRHRHGWGGRAMRALCGLLPPRPACSRPDSFPTPKCAR